MNNKKQYWILYIISITILITIAIQVYWNYNNYKQNKQQIVNEIQLSLDNAIEQYYSSLTFRNHLSIIKTKQDDNTLEKENINIVVKTQDPKDSTLNKTTKGLIFQYGTEFKNYDAIPDIILNEKSPEKIKNLLIYKGKKSLDSLKLMKNLKGIFISILNDSIDNKKVDSILNIELNKRNIELQYSFKLYTKDTLTSSFQKAKTVKTFKTMESKSTFLGEDKRFEMLYSNPSFSAFKRSTFGVILSSILSLAVIFSLFYLLKTINKQKELAEIKNDLISNITHEFKTPITTVSSALEAINSFNVIEDAEKTKKYVSISEEQINKLHIMVEKLLETATLDNEKLLLQKEEIDIVNLIKTITQKHQFITSNKTISFSSEKNILKMKLDEFHFENAISNLIDNAIKYGGNKIDVNVIKLLNKIEIKVIDNGGSIDKNHQEKIFDKFYRIPKGNTHDVKGFGIGLFYVKKIIEKHDGEISVKSNKMITEFKISLPYG